MKKLFGTIGKVFPLLVITFLLLNTGAIAQQNQGAVIGGYGELHYNDVFSDENGPNTPGTLDFHRFILFAGYNFNDWISFRSELELEQTDLWRAGRTHVGSRRHY